MPNRRTFLYQLGTGCASLSLLAALPACQSDAPVSNPFLPRNSPESQGVSSAKLSRFLKAVEKSGIDFHSLMVLRHGQVIAEAWWAPYTKDQKHTLYSLSKSFTSTAIGLAVAEGKLSVENSVLGFFPEYAPEEVNENLQAMKIKHLLTMTTGHDTDTLAPLRNSENTPWVQVFLAEPVIHEPGTHFLYNTGATYVLSAILQKATGEQLLDYLESRVFQPMQIKGVDWETDPEGIALGGYGLRVNTEAIAKLGQWYLQKGEWEGKQLLPAEWVEAATSKQTDSQEGDSDWSQGYGYQFWRCKPGGYRGDGAFGQYCLVMPDQDAVVAITSESFDMQATMNLVWKYVLPAMGGESSLPADPEAAATLQEELKRLALPLPMVAADSPRVPEISGKAYLLEENEAGVKTLSWTFAAETGSFTMQDNRGTHKLRFGLNRWEMNEGLNTDSFFDGSGRNPVSSQLAVSGTWENPDILLLNLRYTDTAHADHWRCQFEGQQVRITFLHSVAAGRNVADSRAELLGQMAG